MHRDGLMGRTFGDVEKDDVNANQFGTARDYERALQAVEDEGIPPNHLALLRAHFAAHRHVATARQLAAAVGYPDYRATNLQYGTLAHRIATELGVRQRPRGFWLLVLVDWDQATNRPGAETTFVMRPPLITALKRLGWVQGVETTPSADEDDDGVCEGKLVLRLVAHRHREASLRAKKIRQALQQSPDGKLRCSVPGCGFCFEQVYGSDAQSYIQVHHVLPLSVRPENVRNRLCDLMLLCAKLSRHGPSTRSARGDADPTTS